MARSRSGRTTAPFGSCVIAVNSRAVAGIEPVEPAAITGSVACWRPVPDHRIDQQAVAGTRLYHADAASTFGQSLPAIARNWAVSSQYRSSLWRSTLPTASKPMS